MEDDLKWKTTSDIKSEISQQLLVRSSPNFKLRLMWPKQMLRIFKWRWPPMEDDIKWKTNSNIKSETTTGQILHKLFGSNQTLQMFQMKTTSNGWQLQIWKVKYFVSVFSFEIQNQANLIPRFWKRFLEDLFERFIH